MIPGNSNRGGGVLEFINETDAEAMAEDIVG